MFGFFWYTQQDELLDMNSAYIYTFKKSGVPIFTYVLRIKTMSKDVIFGRVRLRLYVPLGIKKYNPSNSKHLEGILLFQEEQQ
jgi:hypothetical protein